MPTHVSSVGEAGTDGRPVGAGAVVLGGVAALALALTLGLVGLAAIVGGGAPAGGWVGQSGVTPASAGYGVSERARQDIPPLYLRLYLRAGQRYGLDWAILAGVGAKMWTSVDQACDAIVRVRERVKTRSEASTTMNAAYRTYRRVYPATKVIFEA